MLLVYRIAFMYPLVALSFQNWVSKVLVCWFLLLSGRKGNQTQSLIYAVQAVDH